MTVREDSRRTDAAQRMWKAKRRRSVTRWSRRNAPRSAVQWDYRGRRTLRLVVDCTCGTKGSVLPSATWSCPSCGRMWETSAVPAEEYRSVVRSVTRAKWLAASGVIVTTAVFVPLVVFVSHGLVVPGFVVLAIWYFWFLPSHRKRVRRIYLSLPRWEIKQTSVQRAADARCRPDAAAAPARARCRAIGRNAMTCLV